jgi:hypothetical protein
MDIQLKCAACGNLQIIKLSDELTFYEQESKFFTEDKRAKKKCSKCKEQQLYYYVDENKIPTIMGGSKNYMSMERYWAHNKGEMRRHEDNMSKTMADRHQDRVSSRIDKQSTKQGKEKRYDGYSNGNSEQKLSSD